MALIFGTDDENFLRGTADDDTILGLAAGDQLLGEDGSDTLIGGNSDDLLIGDAVFIFVGGTASVSGGDDRLFGGEGNDRL